MHSYRFLALILVLACGPSAWAQANQPLTDTEAAEKRINAEVERLMNKDPSTAGMSEAIEWERQEWDSLMNAAYKDLLTHLDPQGKDALRDSQRAWIAYRDLEGQAQYSLFGNLQGTMFIPMSVNARARVVKHRAIELMSL
ncbi:MAG: lysozyme inhibitor LprI family protein, partial [Verrucomicrobiota bacterium]